MEPKRPLIQQQPNHQVPPLETYERPPERPTRNKWLLPLLAVVALAIAGALVWALLIRDGEDAGSEPTTGGDETPDVVVVDESEVGVVQNPSLQATATADGLRVDNDGNVTMHGITVVDDGQEICAIETLSPGDGSDCAGASSASVVSGLGPQDQPVEVTVG